MATLTVPLLLDSLRALLDGAALRDAETLAEQAHDADAITAELVRRQRLTSYQADELVHGRGAQLVLGAYVLLAPIGKGGMGQVFRARQRILERECALKIIRRDRLQTDESIERFLREARVAAKLKHANVVAIYDANVADGVHYLAMELLHGVTLAERVKKDGPLEVGTSCRYLRQAATGLQHAFEQGLVHRDIKPQNLFLEAGSDTVKILDLGLARIRELPQDDETATGELTREGEVMGTPDYIAPEQALDTRSADHRADIYSLGCTLCFLLTGKAPFAGGSLTEKLLAHQQKEPPSLDYVGAPPQLAFVLKKAMAKQPANRYQTPAELAEALAPLEHLHDIVAGPSPVTPAQETMTRRLPETTTSPLARPVAKPSTKSLWPLVLILLSVFLCCPVALTGTLVLAWGLLVSMPGVGPDDPKIGLGMDAKPIDNAAALKRVELDLQVLKTFDGRDFVLSADGTRMLHDVSEGFFDFDVRDFETGKKLFSLPKGREGLGFAAGTPLRVVSAKDRTTIFFDAGDRGNELDKYTNPFAAFTEYRSAPDEKTALVAIGKFLIVWDLDAKTEKHRVQLPDFSRHVSYASNGKVGLAVCQNRLQTWTLAADFVDREYQGFDGILTCTALSPDGKWVSAGDVGGRVHIWDKDAPMKPRMLEGLGAKATAVAFSPDSARILCASEGGKMIWTDVVTGNTIAAASPLAPVTRVGIHPDGQRAVTASTDKKIRVWRLPK